MSTESSGFGTMTVARFLNLGPADEAFVAEDPGGNHWVMISVESLVENPGYVVALLEAAQHNPRFAALVEAYVSEGESNED